MQQKLKAFTESKKFQMFFITVIILSGLVVGLDSYPSVSSKYGTTLYVVDKIILLLFVCEILLKMCALGSRCLLYTSPSPRDGLLSRMPSSA